MELEKRARELLVSTEYINIATVSVDGQPWNTPVTGVHDKNLNFYWSSWKEAEHSKNIRANSKIFFTLYDSTRKRGDNNRRCLYFKAEAIEVSDKEIVKKAVDLLYPDESEDKNVEFFLGEGLRRIYKAIPSKAWLNDKSERQITKETVKMRIEVPLEGIKS